MHSLKFAAVVSAALLTGLTLQAADASAEILISSAMWFAAQGQPKGKAATKFAQRVNEELAGKSRSRSIQTRPRCACRVARS
jgi:TRAP-type C4-dicarboxylate transport system substrate-binding protein